MPRTLKTTPIEDGYWMPGEFEPHSGCWMLWPERPDNWREGAVPAGQAFTAVASAISQFEPVTVGVSDRHFAAARDLLPDAVRVVEMTSNDAWMRDVGPTFVVNAPGNVRGVDWIFNAWGGLQGGLYSPWDEDQRVAAKVLEIEARDRYFADFVNEGGAIHVDGQGTLLVTEQCNLNRNRNPGLTRAQVEECLRTYLGATTIVWLGQGVIDDETGGHVDNLVCFVRPGEVCLTWTDDTGDPQHAVSRDAYERLMDARDARGRRFRIHKLQQPGPLTMTSAEAAGIVSRGTTRARRAGDRLAASYVNFYLANGGVVVPLLDPRTDRAALAKLRRIFPRRRVVGVQAREILLGGGNIHCITQQVPASRRRRKPHGKTRRPS